MPLEVDAPLTDLRSIGKGLVAGSLVTLGLFGSDNLLLQLLLFIAGVLVFVDGVMPYTSRKYIGTVAFLALIGALVSVASTLSGFSLAYGMLSVIIFLALYLPKILKRLPRKIGIGPLEKENE